MGRIHKERHGDQKFFDSAIGSSKDVTLQISGFNNTFTAVVDDSGDYDSVGAAYYVIAMVLIYGMSIVLLIGATMRRKRHSRNLDKQVAMYFKNIETIRDVVPCRQIVTSYSAGSASIRKAQTHVVMNDDGVDAAIYSPNSDGEEWLECSSPRPDYHAYACQCQRWRPDPYPSELEQLPQIKESCEPSECSFDGHFHHDEVFDA